MHPPPAPTTAAAAAASHQLVRTASSNSRSTPAIRTRVHIYAERHVFSANRTALLLLLQREREREIFLSSSGWESLDGRPARDIATLCKFSSLFASFSSILALTQRLSRGDTYVRVSRANNLDERQLFQQGTTFIRNFYQHANSLAWLICLLSTWIWIICMLGKLLLHDFDTMDLKKIVSFFSVFELFVCEGQHPVRWWPRRFVHCDAINDDIVNFFVCL